MWIILWAGKLQFVQNETHICWAFKDAEVTLTWSRFDYNQKVFDKTLMTHDYTFPRTIDVSEISDGIIPNHIQIIHLENTWKVWILLSWPPQSESDQCFIAIQWILSTLVRYRGWLWKIQIKKKPLPLKSVDLLTWPPLSESGQCFIARARIYPVAAAISMKFFDCFYRCLDMSAWCLKIYILCFLNLARTL